MHPSPNFINNPAYPNGYDCYFAAKGRYYSEEFVRSIERARDNALREIVDVRESLGLEVNNLRRTLKTVGDERDKAIKALASHARAIEALTKELAKEKKLRLELGKTNASLNKRVTQMESKGVLTFNDCKIVVDGKPLSAPAPAPAAPEIKVGHSVRVKTYPAGLKFGHGIELGAVLKVTNIAEGRFFLNGAKLGLYAREIEPWSPETAKAGDIVETLAWGPEPGNWVKAKIDRLSKDTAPGLYEIFGLDPNLDSNPLTHVYPRGWPAFRDPKQIRPIGGQ